MKCFLLLLLVCLVGCGEQDISKLTWSASGPYDTSASRTVIEYSKISSDKLELAKSRLKDKNFTSDVSGLNLDKSKKGIPYLIRCIQNENKKNVYIFITGNNNIVTQCANMERKGFLHEPVIVYLKKAPQDVLCYIGVASGKSEL